MLSPWCSTADCCRRNARCAGSRCGRSGPSRTGRGRRGRASRSAPFDPRTTRSPRLTWVSEGKPLRRLAIGVKAGVVVGVDADCHMASRFGVSGSYRRRVRLRRQVERRRCERSGPRASGCRVAPGDRARRAAPGATSRGMEMRMTMASSWVEMTSRMILSSSVNGVGLPTVRHGWLPRADSNRDARIQSPLSCRWTTWHGCVFLSCGLDGWVRTTDFEVPNLALFHGAL